VEVNPNALASYDLTFGQVLDAVRNSNRDVGGSCWKSTARIHDPGLGLFEGISDLEKVVVGRDKQGTPIFIGDIAQVQTGPEVRRGVAELDGQGEVVGGIVTARYGENALSVIEKVKEKLEEIKPSLPRGWRSFPFTTVGTDRPVHQDPDA